MHRIFFILVVSLVWFMPQHASVAFADGDTTIETTNVILDGVSIKLPKERWSLSRTGSDWVYFEDTKSLSNLTVWSVAPHWEDSISKFMDRKILLRLDSWSDGYGYSISSQKKGKLKIGSGQEVMYVMYNVDVNGQDRDVAFLYFAEKGLVGQEIRWYRVFIRGYHDLYDATLETVTKIASGLFLIREGS